MEEEPATEFSRTVNSGELEKAQCLFEMISRFPPTVSFSKIECTLQRVIISMFCLRWHYDSWVRVRLCGCNFVFSSCDMGLSSFALFLIWDNGSTPLELTLSELASTVEETLETASYDFPCLEPRKIGTVLLHLH